MWGLLANCTAMLLRSCCACLLFHMRVAAKQTLESKLQCYRRPAAAVSSIVMFVLLQAQEISLNFHCKCEQYVQFASGSFFNFNGTAGETASLISTSKDLQHCRCTARSQPEL